MTFDPKKAAQNLLDLDLKPGDIVSTEQVSVILDTRMPIASDTWVEGSHLQLQRVDRTTLLRKVLLKEHNVFALPGPHGSLELVPREKQVERALEEMKKDVDKSLRTSVAAISNLDLTDLPNNLIADQHNAAAYVDTLRRALNPRARRLKGQIEVPQPAHAATVVQLPKSKRLV
jgi:hypothetical protein